MTKIKINCVRKEMKTSPHVSDKEILSTWNPFYLLTLLQAFTLSSPTAVTWQIIENYWKI